MPDQLSIEQFLFLGLGICDLRISYPRRAGARKATELPSPVRSGERLEGLEDVFLDNLG